MKKRRRSDGRIDPARRRASAHSFSSFILHPSSFGFTLIELLVTLTIIVVLVGILIPVVNKSMAKAHRIRLQADLQTISTALEAYRTDFGDYPRPAAFLSANGTLVAGETGAPNPPSGAEILCRALIGPEPAHDVKASDTIPVQDGADGPGFAIAPAALNPNGSGNYVSQGRVYGPYLAADKFKIYSFDPTLPGLCYSSSSAWNPQNLSTTAFDPLLAFIADIDGNPIQYFPARAVKPDITTPANRGYVALSSQNVSPEVQYTQNSLFDADNGWDYMHYQFANSQAAVRTGDNYTETRNYTSTAYKRICIMFGDYNSANPSDTTYNCDGAIDGPNEQAASVPFILWCAGPDGKFGPDSTTPSASDLNKLDDATNIQ